MDKTFAMRRIKCTCYLCANLKCFCGFEFAALDFSRPEKNQYRYKLEGFDADPSRVICWVWSGLVGDQEKSAATELTA